MIKTSLEWAQYEINILRKARKFTHGNDVHRMIRNIQPDITRLSEAEIQVRRGNKYAADEILIKINNDIELVESYLLVAALIG